MDPPFLLIAIGNATATGSLTRYLGRSFLPWFLFGTLGWFPWLWTKSQLNGRAAPRGAALQTLLAAACAVAVFAAHLIFASAKLPNCDYCTNISALNKLASDTPVGTSARPQILYITNIKEISRSETDIRCSATAKLDNSTDVAIDYRFFIANGRLLGEVQWK